jgi:hypothetical protein
VPPQPITDADPDVRPPWSPLSVSLITLLLPAGGAILTIRNLYRMQQMDGATAKRLTVVAYVIFAIGLTALLLSAKKASGGLLQPDTDASTVLSCGVALASYVVQRLPFRLWKLTHERTRTSPWLGAAGRAALYTLITFAAVLPLCIAGLLLGIGGTSMNRL